MNKELVYLHSDYLLSSFGATTATGLSDLLEGALSHDQITRFLSQQRFDSKTLWQLVKPMVRAIEDDDVLIFDDTIQEKPYTDENELISWHFDHSKNRTVKGINLLNCRSDLGKHFVIALKSNRTVALSEKAKRQGTFSRLEALNLPERQAMRGYLRGLAFPILLVRQVLTNKDGSRGVLYLACSDLDRDAKGIVTIYQKRWNVETFHKTLKSHAALAKSSTRTVRTQSNHCLLAIYAVCRLTWLSVTHGLGHVALRTRLYLKAVRHAFDELQLLKAA